MHAYIQKWLTLLSCCVCCIMLVCCLEPVRGLCCCMLYGAVLQQFCCTHTRQLFKVFTAFVTCRHQGMFCMFWRQLHSRVIVKLCWQHGRPANAAPHGVQCKAELDCCICHGTCCHITVISGEELLSKIHLASLTDTGCATSVICIVRI